MRFISQYERNRHMFSYEELGYYDDRECESCKEHRDLLKDIKYWVQSLIDLVYSDDNFEDFEVYLEELTHVLEMKIHESSPNVCRKKIPTNPLLKEWIKFNKDHLKSLVVNQ